MKTYLRIIILLFFCATIINAQKNISGFWTGKIKMLTMDLQFDLKIERNKTGFNAFMSIPSQKLENYRLQVFTFSKNKVHFELPSQAGIAKFDGDLRADSITGKILQAGIQGIFHLVRGSSVADEKKIEQPLPYFEEEIAFKSGRILLTGTLTTPKEKNKYPAVILISGNGPQNRDEEIFGFKVFEKIADYLTRRGIAVLRYDDRGVGGSTGNSMQSTTEELAEDALAAIDFLKKQSSVDVNKIGLLGHSEGAAISSIVASRSSDAAFIILMSGAGVPGGELLLEQQKLILKASGISEDIISQNLQLQAKINKALSEGKDLNDIRKDIQDFAEEDFETLSKEIKASIRDKKTYINSTVQSQIQMFNNNWFRYFVQYNPSAALRNVKVPVLLLFGDLDLQVPVLQNRTIMEETLKSGGNNKFSTIVFPKANHLYQEAKTGSPAEYSQLKKEFIPGFLDTVSDWIARTIM